MFQNNSCIINGKHTYYDYGMYVINVEAVQPPEVRTNYIEIPGRNGNIDLTDMLTGYPVYGDREITLDLNVKKRNECEWRQLLNIFLRDTHGKKLKVIFDREPDWYYVGRGNVSDVERGHAVGKLTLTITAEPYKYSINDKLPLLTVSGSASQLVKGSDMPTVATFICSEPMTLTVNNAEYQLQKGTNKNYDIVFTNQDYLLSFTGNGTVQTIYKRGIL